MSFLKATASTGHRKKTQNTEPINNFRQKIIIEKLQKFCFNNQ